MSDKSFVDTNIWFYAFVRGDDPARDVKTDAAAACIRGVGHGVLSTQVVSELCVNLIRKADFDENAIRELIDSLFQRYQVAPVSQTAMKAASELREAHKLSYWDSLIVAVALEQECTLLYSEDLQHGQVFCDALKVVNPLLAVSG